MTDTQHTPGPWAVYRAVQNEGEFIIHQGATDIAVTRWALGDCNANARLIAAAPELLAALQACLAVPNKNRPDYIWDNARAAIAKAIGE
jgi:hypothetical protein